MPTYTRKQLRDGVNAVANLTAGTYNFELENTAKNIYFSIEGVNAQIFNSASINTPVNCSFQTRSKNAAFSVVSGSTTTFNLVVTTTIPTTDIKFRATNPLVYNKPAQGVPVTGSFFGIEASY